MVSSAALRSDDYPPSQRDPWYTGKPPLVPAVELAEGRAVVCPFCRDGVHLHDGDGIHMSPGCNGPRARYLVRSLAPAEFVRLMLRRLGFGPEQVQQIMDEIAYARRARLLTKTYKLTSRFWEGESKLRPATHYP